MDSHRFVPGLKDSSLTKVGAEGGSTAPPVDVDSAREGLPPKKGVREGRGWVAEDSAPLVRQDRAEQVAGGRWSPGEGPGEGDFRPLVTTVPSV